MLSKQLYTQSKYIHRGVSWLKKELAQIIWWTGRPQSRWRHDNELSHVSNRAVLLRGWRILPTLLAVAAKNIIVLYFGVFHFMLADNCHPRITIAQHSPQFSDSSSMACSVVQPACPCCDARNPKLASLLLVPIPTPKQCCILIEQFFMEVPVDFV